MRIGLYFGTFNPIHVGHLVIANHMAQYAGLDEVWLVVTPRNPLKAKDSLLADYHRLALVKLAIADNIKLKASDIEFKLEQPSYTSHTLAFLKDKYPKHQFDLIMGEDNLRTFHKWKNHESILKNHRLVVYPRVLTIQEEAQQEKAHDNSLSDHPNVKMVDAPIMKISASFIRKSIKAGKDVQYLLSEPVCEYVEEMHFYE